MSKLLWRVLMYLWTRSARRNFGGDSIVAFNTACFQGAVKRTTGSTPSGGTASEWLAAYGYKSLHGGCHWVANRAADYAEEVECE